MGFQTQVNSLQAPGTAGDFCDANPRSSVDAGPGGLIAGALGVYVARFCWGSPPVDINGTVQEVNNFGAGPVLGFIHREQQGLITEYLAEASMKIPAGFMVTVMDTGGYWAKNDGASQALPGMKAYADFADGKVSFAPTGTPANGGSATGTIAAGTLSVEGSISGDVLTVETVNSGIAYNGILLSGTGVATGTRIVEQISGTPRGVGQYRVSIPDQDADLTTIAGTYGLFTAASALAGTFGIGQPLSGGGTSAGTTITDLGTGVGGLGTYVVNNTQTVGSGTTTSASNVETKWYARSAAEAGGLVKMSAVPLG